MTETPRKRRVLKLVTWGHWYSVANIFLAMAIATIFIFSAPAPDTFLGILYMLTNWISHIGFLIFLGFVLFVLPFCYVVPNERFVKGYAATFSALGLAVLAFDALLFNKQGTHISFDALLQISQDSPTALAPLSFHQWLFLLLLFVLWLGFQLILSNAIWRRMDRFQRLQLGPMIVSVFVGCFVFSHSAHIWADARLYQPIVQQDNTFPLSYPATAKTLMSRYGLLDMQSYRARKTLQFDRQIEQLRYPTAPLYCSITPGVPAVIFVATDTLPHDKIASLGLSSKSRHFSFYQTPYAQWASILYGLPDLYHQSLDKAPVLLEMAQRFALGVHIYGDALANQEGISASSMDELSLESIDSSRDVYLIFASEQQITTHLTEAVVSHARVFIASSYAPMGSKLYSNLDLDRSLRISTNEDLLPTLMSLMSCDADPSLYSTGRSLFADDRQWAVSSDQESLILLNQDQRIAIAPDGDYRVTHMATGALIDNDIDMSLLGQAIELLSRFRDKP